MAYGQFYARLLTSTTNWYFVLFVCICPICLIDLIRRILWAPFNHVILIKDDGNTTILHGLLNQTWESDFFDIDDAHEMWSM